MYCEYAIVTIFGDFTSEQDGKVIWQKLSKERKQNALKSWKSKAEGLFFKVKNLKSDAQIFL